MATVTITQEGKIVLVALGDIAPSSTNPRRAFDEDSLKDLADSIKAVGVQQPIILRPNAKPNAKPYELVAGERRWRASKMAAVAKIPAIIRDLDDDEAREVQIVENLQRADLHPMEEAEAYEALTKSFTFGMTASDASPWNRPMAERISKAVGKSIDYVTKRCRLLALVDEAKEAFRDRDLSLDHALLIASLEPADQERALRFCFNPRGYDKEKSLKALRKNRRDPGKHEGYVGTEISTVRELRHWIEESVALELSKAEWDLADKLLLPEAGPCTTCPKRTGANEHLFGGLVDLKAATCMDGACFKRKRTAFTQITVASIASAGKAVVRLSHSASTAKPRPDKRKDPAKDPDSRVFKVGQFVEAKKGECAHIVTGVFVDAATNSYGEYSKTAAGAKRSVCVDDSCKKHRKSYQRTKSNSGAGNRDWEKERLDRDARVAAEIPLRRKVFDEILALETGWKPDTHHPLMMHLLLDQRVDAGDTFAAMGGARQRSVKRADGGARAMALKPASTELARFLVAALLCDHLQPSLYDKSRLSAERKDLLADAERVHRGPLVYKLIKEHDAAKAKAKSTRPVAGVCIYCGCTQAKACNPPCAWANADQTICDAPPCLKRAKKEGKLPSAAAAD